MTQYTRIMAMKMYCVIVHGFIEEISPNKVEEIYMLYEYSLNPLIQSISQTVKQ